MSPSSCTCHRWTTKRQNTTVMVVVVFLSMCKGGAYTYMNDNILKHSCNNMALKYVLMGAVIIVGILLHIDKQLINSYRLTSALNVYITWVLENTEEGDFQCYRITVLLKQLKLTRKLSYVLIMLEPTAGWHASQSLVVLHQRANAIALSDFGVR